MQYSIGTIYCTYSHCPTHWLSPVELSRSLVVGDCNLRLLRSVVSVLHSILASQSVASRMFVLCQSSVLIRARFLHHCGCSYGAVNNVGPGAATKAEDCAINERHGDVAPRETVSGTTTEYRVVYKPWGTRQL